MEDSPRSDIYNLAHGCYEKFVKLAVKDGTHGIDVIRVLHERFNQWADHLGVFARDFGRPKVSLDSRLRYSDSLRSIVLRYLGVIEESLEDIESLGDSTSGDSHDESPEFTVEQMQWSAEDELSSSLAENLQALESSVESLYRLGIAIRQSPSGNITQRVNAFMEKQNDGMLENLVYLHLKFSLVDSVRMNATRTSTSDPPGAALSLCRQLAMSVTFRYFGVLYTRSHADKIETKQGHRLDRQEPGRPPVTVAPSPEPISAPRPSAIPSHVWAAATRSDTEPSIPDTDRVKQAFATSSQRPDNIAPSVISIRPTQARYPDQPKIEPKVRDFKCPYCRHRFPRAKFEDKAWWERHVETDFRLYACISEECADPPQLFVRFDDWRKHMDIEHTPEWTQLIHRPVSWCCDRTHGEPLSFTVEAEFDKHVRREHTEHADSPALEIFKDWCEIRRKRQPNVCPVCNCIPDKIEVMTRGRPASRGLASSPASTRFLPRQSDIREELILHIADHVKRAGFLSIKHIQSYDQSGEQGSGDASGDDDENQEPLDNGMWMDGEWVPAAAYKDTEILEVTSAPDLLSYNEDWRFICGTLYSANIDLDMATPALDKIVFADDFFGENTHVTPKFDIHTLMNPRYLPRNKFEAYMRRDKVKATIECHFGLYSADVKQGLVEYSHQNPRVFLTLAMSNAINKMLLLRSGKFSDRDLPVHSVTEKGIGVRVYSVNGDQHHFWPCFVARRGGMNNSWDFAGVDMFISRQWTFMVHIFSNNIFRYVIEPERPLPYVNLGHTTTAGGHFARVFKIGLRADHIEFNSGTYFPQDPYQTTSVRVVALKQLRVEGATNEEVSKFFHKEAQILSIMRKLQHPHLIQAIAAYEKGLDRCFIFPWAPGGNLRQLWDRVPGPADRQTTRWAWRQILGLVDGLYRLNHLHGDLTKKGTRHGDLKPENVLIFGSDSGDSGLGQLVIADVGTAKFHAEETAERQAQGKVTTNRHGTLRYAPPEIELSILHTISRKYDSWSLGCVLLEFIIWLVRGSAGLASFNQERRPTGSHFDRFWHQDVVSRQPVLHPAAIRWITTELPWYLARAPALRDLTDLVVRCLLVGPRESRQYIGEFYSGLRTIDNNCSADPTYLWDVPDSGLTRRREFQADVGNEHIVAISQRRTSELVHKWETVNNPSLARELLEGLHWTQWPSARHLTATPCRLCRDCAAINFASQSYELQRSLQHLYRSTDECALCDFLRRRLSALEAKPQEPLRLVRVGAKIQVYPVDQPLISLYCDPVLGSARPTLPFAQLGLPLLPEAASREQFALLKVLVNHCDEKHECMAVQEPPEPPSKLPTRVLDVGGDDDGPIRLVETSHEPAATGRYIALSHRWGDLSQDQRFCTYANNLAQRKERIEYDELPAGFRDAVRVTRALGVRFLWIDSLCIIQEDSEDWAAEAGRMEEVFGHAYCTIAASSAESSLAGFLGGKRPRDAIMLPTPEGAPLYLAEDIDDFRADVENSVLSSRGWVLQERALSRRTIYFTSTQVYWECGNGVVCETLAQLRNPQSRFLGDNDFPSFGLQFYKDERIRLVQHFYAAYSALGLSHASDRSQAVAGLQSRIAQAFSSEASYGVLWRWSQRTLLWCAAQPETLTRIDYRRQSGAPPSWSWMAYDGHITFMEIPFAGVEWKENVWGPPDTAGDGRMSAEASELRVSGDELMARAVLDVHGVEFVEHSWKCVLVGKKKDGQEDDDAHYVLLIRRVPSSGPSDDLYERVGVAVLLASHLSLETSLVSIV